MDTIVLGMITLLILIFLTIFAVFLYSGIFQSIEVGAGAPPVRDLKILYKFGRGPYRNCGEFFSEVSSLAPNNRCLGIYYDDPNQVHSRDLRWAVASILAEGEEQPDPVIRDRLVEKGYQLFSLPHVTNVVKTTFPFNTTLSIFIAIYKVYPRLAKYVLEHRLCAYPFLEIYDGAIIHFMAPLARQDEFFVPETGEGDIIQRDVPPSSHRTELAEPPEHVPHERRPAEESKKETAAEVFEKIPPSVAKDIGAAMAAVIPVQEEGQEDKVKETAKDKEVGPMDAELGHDRRALDSTQEKQTTSSDITDDTKTSDSGDMFAVAVTSDPSDQSDTEVLSEVETSRQGLDISEHPLLSSSFVSLESSATEQAQHSTSSASENDTETSSFEELKFEETQKDSDTF